MELRFQDLFTNILGFQSVGQFGAKVQASYPIDSSAIGCEAYFSSSSDGSVVSVKRNLAVVPEDWQGSGVGSSWLNAKSADESFVGCVSEMKTASFISFHDEFLKFLGPGASLEIAHAFEGEDATHVHEAPVFIPHTGEFLFADTSVVGWLWVLDVLTNEIRKVNTDPPLHNVNGGTLHEGKLYLTTNGGTAPAIYECSVPIKSTTVNAEPETISCTVLVNNFRLNHLNSPNDLVFAASGTILFTDPTYGWAQSWPGVGPPELPTTTYMFHPRTGVLMPLDHEVNQPNGLALSKDEKILYIADSNSTSGKPIGVWEDSVRSVFAFDFDERNMKLSNKRLVHVVESGWPDGLRVSQAHDGDELVLVASMGGVDVVATTGGSAGVLLGKFNVGDDIIFNLEPVRGKNARNGNAKDPAVWLLTGKKAVYKVTIASG